MGDGRRPNRSRLTAEGEASGADWTMGAGAAPAPGTGRDGIGQDVTEDDAHGAGPDRLRPDHELPLPQGQELIVCDAKSGVSGAGRKASIKTSFCEVTENFSAYSILDHRHVPEVLRTSGLEEEEFSFTAQLIPIHRGILETIYFRASEKIASGEDLLAIYRGRYASEPFVRIYASGQVPDLHAVAHTNFCDIGWKYDPATRRTVVVSVIDNLGKGAAGQAIQNMNLALGYPETAGLL